MHPSTEMLLSVQKYKLQYSMISPILSSNSQYKNIHVSFIRFRTFTLESDEDKVKMDKVLEHFDNYCEPRKNTIYERYLFFLRGQDSGESIYKYASSTRHDRLL